MKKVLSITSLLISTNTFAHVSSTASTQQAAEHALLAVLLIPLAWFVARKFSK